VRDFAVPSPRLTVWFDGGCPLCTREIALMRRLDRRGVIAFVDLQQDGTCPIDRATLLARFHAQAPDGPMLSGAEAFAALWRAVPLLRPLGLAARWRPLLILLERAYVLFLRVRPALQRWMRRREAAADHG
jgi:predicted DCC family thiol-disulfide oxidoreductase YuxK